MGKFANFAQNQMYQQTIKMKMKFKNVLFGAIAVAMIGMTSCGGSDSPENVAEDAINAAEKSCPVTESARLGKAASLYAQYGFAHYYVDSVYMAKIYEVKNKYEKEELSENTLKKYKEEYDALVDAQKQAIAEIESRYEKMIDDELGRIFAQTPQIDIPVSISSPWAGQYKEIKCYLSREENFCTLTVDIIANPDGYSKGFTISGEMNFLNHPSFYLKTVNGDDLPSYCDFNGSETDTFTISSKVVGNSIARYADIDSMKVSQH